jgi:signal transduction histidine kinase
MDSSPPRPALSDKIRREARVVGLRDFHTPSLEDVEQRRMQLWILTTILLVTISAGLALLSIAPRSSSRWLTPAALRWGIVLLSMAFCAYAIEKELHLRRLSRLLTDERVLTVALSNRLHEVSLLLDAGKAMNSVLELDAVLDVVLRSASELLSAKSGSIMLAEGDELAAVCVLGNEAARGQREHIGQGVAGHVGRTLEPLLINGVVDPAEFPGLVARTQPVDSAMCVPLLNRDELLGVLNVNAEPDRVFTEYDLRALSLFAEQAAAAIANARLYEAERSHVAELMELDRLKNEFVDVVTHELRTPLTAILAASESAQRPEMQETLAELLQIVERNARHLAAMVEDLLMSVRLEQIGSIGARTAVDVAAIARVVARDFEVTDRPVTVEAPASVPMLGNADAVRRILYNLLDNAHKYGSPPVRLVVEPSFGDVVIRVEDRGGGIPVEEREHVFERFSRIGRGAGKPGLGLGLSIVRGLAASFGGSVAVEDAPGGGAAFRVVLPAFPPHEEAV